MGGGENRHALGAQSARRITECCLVRWLTQTIHNSRFNAAALPKVSELKASSPVARHRLPRYAAVKAARLLLPARWYFA